MTKSEDARGNAQAQNEAAYESLMSVTDLDGVTTRDNVNLVGHLINLSNDLQRAAGLERATSHGQKLLASALLPVDRATLHYFIGNAWAGLRVLHQRENRTTWTWEQPEAEKEITHFRLAISDEGFVHVPLVTRCEALTNMANLLDRLGRGVEAIEYWNRALRLDSSFGMARGNRGLGLVAYSRAMYDTGHRGALLKQALRDLSEALTLNLTHEARDVFSKRKERIESKLTPEFLSWEPDWRRFSMGKTDEEQSYRRWCLQNCLFLNPMNDIGMLEIASHDPLTAPGIVVKLGEGPYYHGYFNQIKQEFVSARFLLFEATHSRKPHFSDNGVTLYNTLDYPVYGLSAEKLRLAFRSAYSVLDKLAFLLNDYLGLKIAKGRVTFRTFWYEDQKRDKEHSLRHEFAGQQNWPLRGLFWLGKDLFEPEEGFRSALEEDAQALCSVRNHLEHKYLKLLDVPVHDKDGERENWYGSFADGMALSVYRAEFEKKALRLLKLARAAIIYVALAIHSEEGRRTSARDPNAIVPPMWLDKYEDQWKT